PTMPRVPSPSNIPHFVHLAPKDSISNLMDQLSTIDEWRRKFPGVTANQLMQLEVLQTPWVKKLVGSTAEDLTHFLRQHKKLEDDAAQQRLTIRRLNKSVETLKKRAE